MRAKKRATAAAAFAAISMGTVIAFWLVFPAWPNFGDYGYAVLMSAFGAGATILAIVLLAVPVLTGRWARQQRLLAFLGAISVASLLVLYLPCGMMLEFGHGSGPAYDVLVALVGIGTAATLLSLALAIATVSAAEPRRHGRLLTT
ncbi:MAG: hypothetical protein ACHP7H_04415 [Hyphomicrobiales bacterium]